MRKALFILSFAWTVLFFGAVFTVGAGAENGGQDPVSKGQELSYSILLSDTHEHVSAGSIELLYDAEIVEFTGGNGLPGISSFDREKGLGVFAFMTPSSVSGTLAKVRFRVKDAARSGARTEIRAVLKFHPSGETETILLGTVLVAEASENETEDASGSASEIETPDATVSDPENETEIRDQAPGGIDGDPETPDRALIGEEKETENTHAESGNETPRLPWILSGIFALLIVGSVVALMCRKKK